MKIAYRPKSNNDNIGNKIKQEIRDTCKDTTIIRDDMQIGQTQLSEKL